jgi:hypothetical protein
MIKLSNRWKRFVAPVVLGLGLCGVVEIGPVLRDRELGCSQGIPVNAHKDALACLAQRPGQTVSAWQTYPR